MYTHLVIQIPCYNEEKTLPQVIADLPKKIEGVNIISTLVVDDGSTDNTYNIANKIAHIVTKQSHSGLSKAYLKGLNRAVFWGANIIVNTDGDNQYCGKDIPKLIKPILDNEADVVIGCRDIYKNTESSWLKKLLYRIGNRLVMCLVGNIPDCTSGFRAMTREVASKLTLKSKFSYTIESLVRIQEMGYRIKCVNVRTNSKTRPSRLFSSYHQFIWKQAKVILWAIGFKLLRRFD